MFIQWFLVVRIQAKAFQLDRKTRSSPRSCRPLSPRMPSSRALSSKFALGPTSCATCCNKSWKHRCWSTWVPELFWSFSDWKIGGFLKWGVAQNHGGTRMKWSNDLDDWGIPSLDTPIESRHVKLWSVWSCGASRSSLVWWPANVERTSMRFDNDLHGALLCCKRDVGIGSLHCIRLHLDGFARWGFCEAPCPHMPARRLQRISSPLCVAGVGSRRTAVVMGPGWCCPMQSMQISSDHPRYKWYILILLLLLMFSQPVGTCES